LGEIGIRKPHFLIAHLFNRASNRLLSLSAPLLVTLAWLQKPPPVGDPSKWSKSEFTVWGYFEKNWDRVLDRTWEHVELVLISVAIAIVIGVMLGIYITYHELLARIVLYTAGIIMTIPSIAMWGFLLILMSRMGLPGIGIFPAVVGLVLYSQLPIIRNTYTAFKQLDPKVLEAAEGMGMSPWQLFFKVKFPLAVPVLMAGVRNAVIINIGIAALAIFIGAGGLGDLILRGIDTSRKDMIIAGALAASLLALTAEGVFATVERALTPKGIRLQRKR